MIENLIRLTTKTIRYSLSTFRCSYQWFYE